MRGAFCQNTSAPRCILRNIFSTADSGMPMPPRHDERLLRALLTAALAGLGLAVHLGVQRLAPPPVLRVGDGLVGLTPFLPWTIWIYLLFFPVLVATGMLVPRERWPGLMVAWTLASIASWILVLVVPVTFARPPIADLDPVHRFVLGRVWTLDAAHVTFPCLHSAVTWIAWAALRDRGPRLRAGFLVLAAAITLSTMTTRQHLLTDNGAALLIAWACCRTALAGVARKPVKLRGTTRAGDEAGAQLEEKEPRTASGSRS
jgi:hypothetical protein